MWRLLMVMLLVFAQKSIVAQNVKVLSGGEMVTYGNTDISMMPGIKWQSAREGNPGFFSVIAQGNFSGYSDSAHIDGYVKKYGNTSFTFPVGSGTDLRTLEIAKPEFSTDAYAAAWIAGDPGINTDPTFPFAGLHSVSKVSEPLAVISTAGQWDWLVGDSGRLGDQSTGNGNGLNVTVSIPDLSGFATKAELRLVGWNGEHWIDLSGKPSATGNKENDKLTGTMLPGITAIAIGKIKPVIVGRFDFVKTSVANCQTRLQWKTTFEMDSSYFVIEQSVDGVSFLPIDTISASGSVNGNTYSLFVSQPRGVFFYRIRLENYQTYFTFSPAVTNNLDCREPVKLLIYPNPINDKSTLKVRFFTEYTGIAYLNFYNAIGQKIKSQKINCLFGNNLITTNVVGMTPGWYVVELRDAYGRFIAESNRLIKL